MSNCCFELLWSREKEMPMCAARPLSPQFRRKAGTSRHIQTFKRCVEEFRRISVEYLKSEVRPWDSDVRRKIGQKYHSCGAKMTCAASKLTCAILISSVREEFYHWNFSKCNMYVRIINVQTGTHSSMGARLHIYYPHVHVTFCRISMIKMLPHTWY